MKRYLIKLADHLDQKGLHKEADYVDWLLKKADDFNNDFNNNRYNNAIEIFKQLKEARDIMEKALRMSELEFCNSTLDIENFPENTSPWYDGTITSVRKLNNMGAPLSRGREKQREMGIIPQTQILSKKSLKQKVCEDGQTLKSCAILLNKAIDDFNNLNEINRKRFTDKDLDPNKSWGIDNIRKINIP